MSHACGAPPPQSPPRVPGWLRPARLKYPGRAHGRLGSAVVGVRTGPLATGAINIRPRRAAGTGPVSQEHEVDGETRNRYGSEDVGRPPA